MKPLIVQNQIIADASAVRVIRRYDDLLAFGSPFDAEVSVHSPHVRHIQRRWMLTDETLSESVARSEEVESCIHTMRPNHEARPIATADNAPVPPRWMLLETDTKADYLPTASLMVIAICKGGIALEYPDFSYLLKFKVVTDELAERFSKLPTPRHITSRPPFDYWVTPREPRIHADEILMSTSRRQYTRTGLIRILRSSDADMPPKPSPASSTTNQQVVKSARPFDR